MAAKRCWCVLVLATLILVGGSAGCGIRYLGDSQALLTGADQRLVINSPAKFDRGRNVPEQIFCAEPSPDVAKALSEAFNVSAALDAVARGRDLPVDGALKAAAAISQSRAEAMAQLTNRLATIQLLRDALYRACEAYRNGALSEITYAIMLSRFDKLMVTMLTGELVAGNFGQSLAVLGTSAGGASQAALTKVAQDANKATESQKAVDDAREDLEVKRTNQADAVKALSACTDDTCRAARQKDLEDKRREVAAANERLVTTLVNTMGDATAAASSTASVLVAQGVGAVRAGQPAQGQADTARALETMQRKYLENINADPLVVSCLTAFDREETGRAGTTGPDKTLVNFCQKEFPRVLRAQDDVLRARLIDSQTEVVNSCLSAFKDANSMDAGVSTTAKALKEFCEKRLVDILQTRSDLLLKEKQLEDARVALARARREPVVPKKDGSPTVEPPQK